MNTKTLTFTQSVTIEECITCGGPIALGNDQRYNLMRNHNNYYCPIGHLQHYSGESDADKAARMQRERDEARAERDTANRAAELARRSLRKIRTRVKNGVCPCCHRTFQNVSQHMKTKHPDFGETGNLK